MNMPWIKEDKLYPIIALILILIIAVRTPLETDMWWHLRAGEETLKNSEVYSVDTFSFTREGSDWINHSWLSQVVMFLFFQAAGYYGLSIWVGLCAALAMLFIYLQMKGHPLMRSAVLLFAAVVSSVVWSPRPQIHTLVLFSLLGYLIYQYKRTKDYRYLLGFLPVFALWGNLHGGYVLGTIFLGTIIAGEILNKVLFKDFPENLTWKQIGLFAIFTMLSLLAVLINPFGFGMWKIPFNTIGVETLQNVISEWASPDFHQAFQQPMLWMMLGAFSLAALSKKEIDGTDLVPLAAFSWAALVARRNFGPFAIVAAPIFSKYLDQLLNNWLMMARDRFEWIGRLNKKIKLNNKDLNPVIKNLVNLFMIIILLGGLVWKVVYANDANLVKEAERAIFPVEAVEIMDDIAIPGNILNEYNWGGYLIWNLRSHHVFVDGRTDLFGDEIINEWSSILNAEPHWITKLEQWDVDYILANNDWAIMKIIEEPWEIIFSNDSMILFQRVDRLDMD